MTKLTRSLALMLALAVTAGGTLALAVAQEPKAKAAPQDKKKDAKEAKLGSVEIYKAKDGYRFRIKNADGKTVAMATKGYEAEDDVVKLLDDIKTTLTRVKVTKEKD